MSIHRKVDTKQCVHIRKHFSATHRPRPQLPPAQISRRTQTHKDCPYPMSRAAKLELDLKRADGAAFGGGARPTSREDSAVCRARTGPMSPHSTVKAQATTCRRHLKIKTKKNRKQILTSSRVTREKVCSICNPLWNIQLKQGLAAGPDRWDRQTDRQTDSRDKEVRRSW